VSWIPNWVSFCLVRGMPGSGQPGRVSSRWTWSSAVMPPSGALEVERFSSSMEVTRCSAFGSRCILACTSDAAISMR